MKYLKSILITVYFLAVCCFLGNVWRVLRLRKRVRDAAISTLNENRKALTLKCMDVARRGDFTGDDFITMRILMDDLSESESIMMDMQHITMLPFIKNNFWRNRDGQA